MTEYKKFEQILATINAGATATARGEAFQADYGGEDGSSKWVFMNNQKIYAEQAFSGALIGVAIAFFVIFVATRRPLVALYASTSILLTLVSVVGAMTMIWHAQYDDYDALDTTNSILITILAGFSVDYVVHLA